MTTSQKRINQLCDEENITISMLEKRLGFSNGYINGKRKREFPTDRLDAIAKALSTTTDYLMGKTDNSYGKDIYLYDYVMDLPEPTQQLIGLFNELNDEGQAEVLKYAKTLIASGLYKQVTVSVG